MGYSTDFWGEVRIDPPLNASEKSYLQDFASTRRMKRENGPYFVKATGFMGQGPDEDVQEYNGPDITQPGLWCQWVPTEDGSALEWDGGEKFYSSVEWMKYLINAFLSSEAKLKTDLEEGAFEAQAWPVDERFKDFTFDHVVNGEIDAQGEDLDDRWKLTVEDNEVRTFYAIILFEEEV